MLRFCIALKNPSCSAGFEPASLGTNGTLHQLAQLPFFLNICMEHYGTFVCSLCWLWTYMCVCGGGEGRGGSCNYNPFRRPVSEI
jgi:hypothetical protein